MTPLDRVLGLLTGVRQCGAGHSARCPAHDDRTASLSVSEGDDGRALLCCHAGCTAEAVVAALGLAMRDLYPVRAGRGRESARETIYVILAADGRPVAEHVRVDLPGGGKRMWWRLPGASRRGLAGLHTRDLPLYGVERLRALPDGESVVVTEGERAADALIARGIATVGTVTGASGTPADAVLRALVGRDVVLWPDADDAGRGHMRRVAARLAALGVAARWLTVAGAAEGDDAVDVTADTETVREWIAAAPEWMPADESHDDGDGRDDAGRGQTSRGRVVLIDLSTVVPQAVAWAWQDRIALRAINVVSGEGGVGKSTIIFACTARWTHGTLKGDLAGAPAVVAVTTAEDALASVAVPRLIVAGADLTKVAAVGVEYSDATGVLTLTPERLRELRSVLVERRVKILVLDPLVAYLPGAVDSHRDADIRRVLAPLAKLAEELDLAVVAIIHLNKNKSTNPLVRICGSVAFGNAARSVLLAGRDPASRDGNDYVLAHAKCNYGPRTVSRRYTIAPRRLGGGPIKTSLVEWGDEVPDIGAEDLLREPSARRHPAMDDAAAFLRRILADGPMRQDEIERHAKKQGIKPGTLRRVKRDLGIAAEPVRAAKDGKEVIDFWQWRIARGDPPPSPKPSDAPESEPSEGLHAQVPGVEHLDLESHPSNPLTPDCDEGNSEGLKVSTDGEHLDHAHLENKPLPVPVPVPGNGLDPDDAEVF